jgi:hypothetical protein
MNSLGSLSGFQTDPSQDHGEVTGMRNATGYEGGNRPAAAPPLVGATGTAAIAEEQQRNKGGRPPIPDSETLAGIAGKVEAALKELKRPKINEGRIAEIDSELRSIVPALIGEIQRRRREAAAEILRKFYHPRYHRFARQRTASEFFATVVESRTLSADFGNSRTHGDLVGHAQSIVELFRLECQNEVVS